jgi:hypothetical protein
LNSNLQIHQSARQLEGAREFNDSMERSGWAAATLKTNVLWLGLLPALVGSPESFVQIETEAPGIRCPTSQIDENPKYQKGDLTTLLKLCLREVDRDCNPSCARPEAMSLLT